MPVGTARRAAEARTAAQAWYAAQLRADEEAQAYLQGRGIDLDLAHRLGIGYAPRSWTGVVQHLRGQGYPDEVITATGLAIPTARRTIVDRFRARIMLPVRDEYGRPVAFTGRATPAAAPDAPRYLDSPTGPDYRKGHYAHGLWEGRHRLEAGAVPVLTEGVFDAHAVTLASRGRYVGLAPSGTALTIAQVTTIDRAVPLDGTRIVVAFDPDQPGQDAAITAWPLLAARGAQVDLAVLPHGLDPAELARQQGAAPLVAALNTAQPMEDRIIDACLNRWEPRRWAEQSVGAVRDVAKLTATLPPGRVSRQVARIAHRLDVPVTEVTAALVDVVAPEPDPTSSPDRYLEPEVLPELQGPRRGTGTSTTCSR